MLAEWWDELPVEGTPGHRLLSGLGQSNEDMVVAKRRYDAFHQTSLELVLRSGGAREVVLAGVMTNLCVETTARQAFVRDFRVRVLLDATATASEELHVGALVGLAHACAHVQSVDELLEGVAP